MKYLQHSTSNSIFHIELLKYSCTSQISVCERTNRFRLFDILYDVTSRTLYDKLEKKLQNKLKEELNAIFLSY